MESCTLVVIARKCPDKVKNLRLQVNCSLSGCHINRVGPENECFFQVQIFCSPRTSFPFMQVVLLDELMKMVSRNCLGTHGRFHLSCKSSTSRQLYQLVEYFNLQLYVSFMLTLMHCAMQTKVDFCS